METVLVTGGAGFIGSHIVDALIKQGFRVVVVDNLSAGKRENVNPEAIFHHLDIGSDDLAGVFAKDKIDWVSHHAAQIDVRRSVDDPPHDARVNILGLLNLLGNCLRYHTGGVVLASSGGVVYGEPDEMPVAETFPKRPLSPYGVAKLASEYYLYYYHCVQGLPYIALRYGNVYGPRQDPTGEAGVASIFGGRMLAGQTPTIFGDGQEQRDYVFVADVVKANLLALQRLAGLTPPASLDDNAYNIGTGTGTSVNELFDRLKEITGFDKVARYAAARTGELNKMVLDTAKAAKGLSWQPAVSLPDGLGELIGYLRGRIGKTRA